MKLLKIVSLKLIISLIIFLTFITIILTITAVFNNLWWRFEYTASFRHQCLFLQLILICLLLALKVKKEILYILITFTLINLIPFLSFYIPQTDKAGEAKTIKILTANVHIINDKYNLLISLIKNTDPSVIALSETDDKWIDNLAILDKDYYSIKHPGKYLHGMALYSKYPFTSKEIKYYSYDKKLSVPMIFATINVEGKDFKIITIHPIAPKDKNCIILRNRHLLEAAEMIKKEKSMPVILAGDLNITPWSYKFSEFLKISGLKDSSKGFGLQPTWPVGNPLLLTPIDHFLISKNLTVIHRYTGPDIGSDHYPVIMEIKI